MDAKIVVLDGFTLNPGDNPWDELQSLGDTHIFDRSSPEQVLERAKNASILVVNKVRIGSRQIESLPSLRFVAVTATGYDCVDTTAARECGIPVTNVPVYGTDSVAQHVFALLLHILHRTEIHDQAIRDGRWQESGDFSFWLVPLSELSGKTIGIIGFGRIGRRVAEIARVFGMRILAASRSHKDRPDWPEFEWSNIERLAKESDVISLHCPLTDQTRGMVNSEFLSQCKPSAILINTGRGPLIIEEDLASALASGQIRAAGLDVVSQEPINSDNPLLNVKSCFLTPHLAWATLEARQRLMATTVENIAGFLNGNLQNVVNGVSKPDRS